MKEEDAQLLFFMASAVGLLPTSFVVVWMRALTRNQREQMALQREQVALLKEIAIRTDRSTPLPTSPTMMAKTGWS